MKKETLIEIGKILAIAVGLSAFIGSVIFDVEQRKKEIEEGRRTKVVAGCTYVIADDGGLFKEVVLIHHPKCKNHRGQ